MQAPARDQEAGAVALAGTCRPKDWGGSLSSTALRSASISAGHPSSTKAWYNGLRSNISGITPADVTSSDLKHGFSTGFASGSVDTCLNLYG
jgi:hypothetical protein